ncbi:hypothetical protein E2C01_057582 [Portunus trituberculatus]|uniref:Uncharacterized protein n=1 Tax=Portunus trituberculatus TaxID=210409 RepID=A0A5B7H3S3_PORTR|nr:hypothetical protein [Portunus trituberculatus]
MECTSRCSSDLGVATGCMALSDALPFSAAALEFMVCTVQAWTHGTVRAAPYRREGGMGVQAVIWLRCVTSETIHQHLSYHIFFTSQHRQPYQQVEHSTVSPVGSGNCSHHVNVVRAYQHVT